MRAATRDPGSFRDPSGVVFESGGKVYRALSERGWATFLPVLESGILDSWASRGDCVSTVVVADDRFPDLPPLPFKPAMLLEHGRVAYVSYPYEWPFELLKRAALLHLNLQIEALNAGFCFSDSSAYNVQFQGPKPLLMDVLSVRPYREGDIWFGYRQFCEQFLNPLLLTAKCGVEFGPWYRGALHGIGIEDLARLLPLRSMFSFNILSHVLLHAKLTENMRRRQSNSPAVPKRNLSRRALSSLLQSMARWIQSLNPSSSIRTFWEDYEKHNSYAPEQAEAKRAFIHRYVRDAHPTTLFDIGCNSGEYSEIAMAAGVESAVGFDFDQGALSAAVARASSKELDLLPLHLDVSNPSPNQGWGEVERKGFGVRCRAEGLLALALIHHIVIGNNVPIDQAVQFLVEIAPTGVIEFVPKADPMVVGMLSSREDIFDNYDLGTFRALLSERADIVAEAALSAQGRTLFQYVVRQ